MILLDSRLFSCQYLPLCFTFVRATQSGRSGETNRNIQALSAYISFLIQHITNFYNQMKTIYLLESHILNVIWHVIFLILLMETGMANAYQQVSHISWCDLRYLQISSYDFSLKKATKKSKSMFALKHVRPCYFPSVSMVAYLRCFSDWS